MRRCTQCGGVVREIRAATKCDACGIADPMLSDSPDLWDFIQHPEDFTTEVARLRTLTRRRSD